MGLGWFLSVDWFPACSDSEMTSTSSPCIPSSTHKPTTSSCVCQQSLPRLREWYVIMVALCHGSVYCASMPAMLEVCQHARWSSWSVCASLDIPGCSSCPRCPEGQDIVPLCQMAQNAQDCTYGSDLFVMMILVCFTLSCDGQMAVFVTFNC